MPLPRQAQPISVIQGRFKEAFAREYPYAPSMNPNDRPTNNRACVFDCEDGMRLIAFKEIRPDKVVKAHFIFGSAQFERYHGEIPEAEYGAFANRCVSMAIFLTKLPDPKPVIDARPRGTIHFLIPFELLKL
jgi:hypothetical protein